MKSVIVWMLIGLLLLSACAPAEPTPNETASTPQQTAATTTPAIDSQSLATGVVYGRNDDGTFYHGAPDAPVTLIDYSDFL